MQHDIGRLEFADVDAVAIFRDEQLVERGQQLAANVALEVDAADNVDPDAARQSPLDGQAELRCQIEVGIDDLDMVLAVSISSTK